MQKSLLSQKPKSKPVYFSKQNENSNFSTIQHQFSDIDNVQLIFSDQHKLPIRKLQASQKQSNKSDSVHLQIQLDDGKVEMIFPKINDNPFTLAKQFCVKHELDDQMLDILTQNIRQTINKLDKNRSIHKKKFATQPIQQSQPKRQDSNRHKISPIIEFTSRQYKQQPDLYQRCARQQTSKKTWRQRQKMIKSRSQLIECTHSPKINPISEKICNIRPNYKSYKRQNQFNSVRSDASIATEPFDQKQVTKFEYNNKENELHNVFEYLYQEGKVKELKKQQKMQNFLKLNCNFQPQINATSRRIVGDKSFEQRLNTNKKSSVKARDSKNKSMVSSISKSKDDSLPKYHVKIQSFKQYSHTKPTVPNPTKSLSKVKNNASSTKPSNASSSKSIITKFVAPSSHTEKLYQNQKQKAFKSIFCLLDEDNDGSISILNINLINGVEHKLIQVLFPVLQELEILQTELNVQEFCQAMDKLFGSISVEEKGYLLKYCHKLEKQDKFKQIHQNQSNKPTMTPISTQMVNQTSRRNVTVYEYSKLKQELKQQKLQQQRVLKEKSLMRNCTFHPKVNPKKAIYF